MIGEDLAKIKWRGNYPLTVGTQTWYCDRRILGVERWYYRKPLDGDMQIPDNIRKCVAFIGCIPPGKTVPEVKATGFFVGMPNPDSGLCPFVYLVTARHVIDKIRDLNCSEVWVRWNFKDGTARQIPTPITEWMFHPNSNDEDVDVAVLNVNNAPENIDHSPFALNIIATTEALKEFAVGPGDEVFLAGLFRYHYGESGSNIPIIRVGNIAAMPESKVETRFGRFDAYLIETRSMGGLSGSPVFLHLGDFRRLSGSVRVFTPGGAAQQNWGAYLLLGLMHGHWDNVATLDYEDYRDEQRGINTGIGIVVPVQKIIETVRQQKILENETRALKAAQEPSLPSMDFAQNEVFTKEEFEKALRKVSKRIQPSQSDEEK